MTSWQTIPLTLVLLAPARAPGWQGAHPVSGREIAPVMGMGGADWLVRAEREREEEPERALDAIGVKSGMKVGDVGAGVGYFSLRMAQRVGAEGKVYANEIQAGMLDRLRRRMREAGATNIEPVLGTVSDPKLPAGELDLVLLVDVYHEFSQPQAMLRGIARSLKPDGRLVLLEYRKEDPKVPIREEHKMSIPMVQTELEAEGFRLEKVLHDLPRQHILIFRKAKAN
jgi:predicted methyltransferase